MAVAFPSLAQPLRQRFLQFISCLRSLLVCQRKPDLREEIQNAEEPEAGLHGGWDFQAACFKFLPAEDRSLPLQAIPQPDEESTHCPVLVVPTPDADPGPPFQGMPQVEFPAEDPVGRGAEGERKGETLVQDPRHPADRRCNQAVLDALSATDVEDWSG